MTKIQYLEKAVKWAEKRSTTSLESISEGYKSPKTYMSKTNRDNIQADISFITVGGAQHYSVVALKDQDPQKLVTRCKVLSFMATMMRGDLHLLAPSGHKAFAEKLVFKYHINAVIHSL